MNIYAHNNIKCQLNFFSQLKNLLLKEECINSNEIIIGGDFNCVQDPTFDKNGGSDNRDKSRVINTINVLMNTFDLHDIWRIRNPDKKQFTWRQKTPRIQCRLDYWLISDCLHEYTRETNIKFAPFTDHSAITLELENPKFQSQRIGYWKFNLSLTTDANYQDLIRNNLAIWIKESEEITDKRIQWDYIKYKIGIETIVYCKTKCKNSRKREKFINDQIKLIEQSDTSCDDEEKTSKLEEYKIQLEEIYSEKTNGAIIRSKARWHEEGEKSTKYFLSLEKRNHSKKCMKKLQLNDSTITDNQQSSKKNKRNIITSYIVKVTKRAMLKQYFLTIQHLKNSTKWRNVDAKAYYPIMNVLKYFVI